MPLHAPGRAHREIAELGRLVGGVPALHDAVETLRPIFLAVTLEPFRLDQSAAQRGRRLLILAGEVVFADRAANAVEGFERFAVGMQGFALTAPEALRSPDRLDPVHLVGFGDRRKAQNLPTFLRKDVTDEVVFVQPLHDDHDGAMALVVEPAVKGVVVPLVGGFALRIGERLLRLQRIIDQDDVGAASGEHPAGGGGEPVTLPGGDELLYCLAVRGEAGREDLPIPRAQHDAAAIAGELVGEILGVADAEDLGRRIVSETPRREGDRRHQGFEVAGRQVDDQPPDVPLAHRGQLRGDDFEMPIHGELGLRVEVSETAVSEAGKILPQDGLVIGRGQVVDDHSSDREKRALSRAMTFSSAALKAEVSGGAGSVRFSIA